MVPEPSGRPRRVHEIMPTPNICDACRRPADASRLEYRGKGRAIRNAALVQCDVCERFVCAECMQVYEIVSGYDFLCNDCAREVEPGALRAAAAGSAKIKPASSLGPQEIARSVRSRIGRRTT